MGMPVKLSDELVTAARAEAEASQRSIAAQVEHWARLGRAVEAVLPHPDVVALKRAPDLTAAFPDRSKREAVLALLNRLESSPERSAALRRVRGGERPVYGSDPAYPGLVVRIDPDGTRTPGRFENRRFVPAA
jgi:hypothetical protein